MNSAEDSNKNQPYFYYKLGQERDIVVEHEKFEQSIFADQYAQALRVVRSLIADSQKNALKCVAFCGDRGEGKTSAMTTVKDILSLNKVSNFEDYLRSIKLDELKDTSFFVLDVTDPAFFDDSHNIVEITISKLYNEFLRHAQASSDISIGLRNDIQSAFGKVNRSLNILKEDDFESLNDIHRLSTLSVGIQLREEIAKLVELFLTYVGKNWLVIPIDDIDLNIAHAYTMSEQIRKYFCVPQCLVLISVKVTQLREMVADRILSGLRSGGKNSGGSSIVKTDEIIAMADKYVKKLIPVSSRIIMPKAYTMMDMTLDMKGVGKDVPLKQAVVELIFNRTRYLFYNPYDSVSPIVPNNLRDLLNLIGLLASMESIPDSHDKNMKRELERNKQMFKSFFYTVWMSRFNAELREKLNLLIEIDYGTSFNNQVISLLKGRFISQRSIRMPKENIFNKDYQAYSEEEDDDDYYEEEDHSKASRETIIRHTYMSRQSEESRIYVEINTPSAIMIDSILNDRNFGYNLTIGDVFYLFSNLESDKMNDEDSALIFFLKSLYSIKLYDTYDRVTEHPGLIYPAGDDLNKGISIVDSRFIHSNSLQQLTGGSYFTYCPGDLLPVPKNNEKDKSGGSDSVSKINGFLDLRIINGKALNSFLSSVRNDIKTYLELKAKKEESERKGEELKYTPEEEDFLEIFPIKLRLAEFFMLTIKASVPYKQTNKEDTEEVVKATTYLRKNVEAWLYRSFSNKTGYYLFDIMAPFGTLMNFEFAYRRFEVVDDEFFKFILDFKESLWNEVVEACKGKRHYITHENNNLLTDIHRVLSDCVIRNGEVLSNLIDFLEANRRKNRGNGIDSFFGFYGELQKGVINIQRTAPEGDRYKICYDFLAPFNRVLDYINSARKKDGENRTKAENELLSLFLEIYERSGSRKQTSVTDSSDNSKEAVSENLNRKIITPGKLYLHIHRYLKRESVRKALEEFDVFRKLPSKEWEKILLPADHDKPYSKKDKERIAKRAFDYAVNKTSNS